MSDLLPRVELDLGDNGGKGRRGGGALVRSRDVGMQPLPAGCVLLPTWAADIDEATLLSFLSCL